MKVSAGPKFLVNPSQNIGSHDAPFALFSFPPRVRKVHMDRKETIIGNPIAEEDGGIATDHLRVGQTVDDDFLGTVFRIMIRRFDTQKIMVGILRRSKSDEQTFTRPDFQL